MSTQDFSRLQDRGVKKWQGMMITEHVTLLKKFNEDQKKTPRPELDEWDLDTIQETIEIAMKRNVEIRIKLWREGEVILRGGLIKEINLKYRTMDVKDPYDVSTYKLDDIIDVSILE